MTAPLKLIFAGSGEFGTPSLHALIDVGHQISVFTQPDRPAGRGKKLTPTPIALLAMERGLTLCRTADLNSEPLPTADAMVVIAFGQKIGEQAVNHPRLGSMNLHGSILPKYRGAAPINWAILNGEEYSGNSMIRLAQKMDSGAILAQSRLLIGPTETAGDLHDRLAIDGAELVQRVLGELVAGSADERPQDHAAATLAPKLSRRDAILDWSQTAETVARRINGLSPWPGCHVRLLDAQGKEIAKLALLRARPAAESGQSPGQIMEHGTIGADGGGVEILELQPEGRKAMKLTEYQNGHIWAAGLRVESI